MQQISEAIGFLAMTLIQLTHSFNTIPLRYPNVQATLPEIEKNKQSHSKIQPVMGKSKAHSGNVSPCRRYYLLSYRGMADGSGPQAEKWQKERSKQQRSES